MKDEAALRQYVDDLFARMQDRTKLTHPEDTRYHSVAIVAHDEARELADERFIPLIVEKRKGIKDQYEVCDIYFTLHFLSLNCHSIDPLDYFLDELRKEKRLFVAEYLMDKINSSPFFNMRREEILPVVLPFVGKTHYGAMTSANDICARFRDHRIGDTVVDVLTSTDPRPYQVNSLLWQLGSQQDMRGVEFARKYIEHNKADAVLGAVSCLGLLLKDESINDLVGLLGHGSDDVRSLALRMMCRFGTEEHLEPIAKHLLGVTNRRRVHGMGNYESNVNYGALYLHHYIDKSEVSQDFFMKLSGARWQKLFDNEREFLAMIAPKYFSGLQVFLESEQERTTG